MTERVNLLNYDQSGLREFFQSIGEAPFRANQVIKWIHRRGVTDINGMTDISKPLRLRLMERCEIRLPEVIQDKRSKDGTRKWLLRFDDGNCIETVFIPDGERGTVCISSQVGCTLNCRFCSTGKQGFSRNLTTSEIIAQLWIVQHTLRETFNTESPVTNVVMMGMGEPLFNFENVLPALHLMRDACAYQLSKYRVTLSTSGVVPTMHRLRESSEVALAVSLHAPNDALRNTLVPLNKKYPLSELIPVCRDYFQAEPRRKVTFEYVMLRDVNDTLAHARELIHLLEGMPCKINLIPFNPFPYTEYQCSTESTMLAFQASLMQAGFMTHIRRTRGEDIDAACGQLAGRVKDWTRRHSRWRAKRGVIPIVQESM